MNDSQKIADIINGAEKIIVIQADNLDADSLGSALALEQILHDLGKNPQLLCAVEVPSYLKYLKGWSRVSNELPIQFDASIIVDASTVTLLEKLEHLGAMTKLAAKPCIVLDHHEEVSNKIEFASVMINDVESSSTGEVVYALAKKLNWQLSIEAQEYLMTAILGDTQGLSNSLARATTYRVLADMVDNGVDRPKLEEERREVSKMPQSIYKYKSELIKRTEFYLDGKIALVTVPQNEINEYSPLYNPAPLIQGDMLTTEGVGIAIVIKAYDDGHITAAIRCNLLFPIGAKLAEHFGGGGHKFASGYKVSDGRDLEKIKTETISFATKLLKSL